MATHFPSGHYTDVTYGNGGPSRHQCGGCGAPIVPRLEAWVHALTSSVACPGNTAASDEIAKAAGTPEEATRECRVHGTVPDDHFPCRVPGETADQFTNRVLGYWRDV
jgi:hypothetical protein